MRVMLDTCVILDGLHRRSPFCSDTADIFCLAGAERFEGFVSAKAVADIYYISHKELHDNKQARKLVDGLIQVIDIVDTTAVDCQNALISDASDFEDAIMIETAQREKMDCIVTRNTIDYKRSRIPIYTPKEFLALMGVLCRDTQEGIL